jgi:hypothetical protein
MVLSSRNKNLQYESVGTGIYGVSRNVDYINIYMYMDLIKLYIGSVAGNRALYA